MKLLVCLNCASVFSLSQKEKACDCGASKGRYTDPVNAVYSGPAITLGFENMSLLEAIKNQPKNGQGKRFEAFVIPKICRTFNKADV